jgi:hypothetical protein
MVQVKLKVINGRTVAPRDGRGAFAPVVNLHPAHVGRVVGDLAGEAVFAGVRDSGTGAIKSVLGDDFPSQSPCDPAVGVGSGNGRDTALFDKAIGLVGYQFKLVSADKESAQAGASVLTTQRPENFPGIFADFRRFHAAGGKAPVVSIRVRKDAGAYILDADSVEFDIRWPWLEFAGDYSLADADARALGRGRPRAGTILPATWAGRVKSTCKLGYSVQLSFRHAPPAGGGWETDTLAGLRARLLAL